MRIQGVPYQPRFSGDELALGAVAAFLLRCIVVGPFIVKAILPKKAEEEEKPRVAAPYVEANLLKLGSPVNPAKLPDRFIPKKNLAPKKEKVASREDPSKNPPDAGPPPPPDAEDSDIKKLITN